MNSFLIKKKINSFLEAKKNTRAFTLVEILVVLASVTILVSISFVSYDRFNKNEALEKDAVRVIALYEEARALSLGSNNGSVYGVHAETTKVVRFKGEIYTAGDSDNIQEFLSNYATISSISLSGGGSDVVFSRLGGTTTKSGTITLSLKSVPAQTKVISIYLSGVVDIN